MIYYSIFAGTLWVFSEKTECFYSDHTTNVKTHQNNLPRRKLFSCFFYSKTTTKTNKHKISGIHTTRVSTI